MGIKATIKKIVGDVTIYRMREFKNRVTQNEYYKREQEEIPRRKMFYSQFVRENDLCFDVGANSGNRVLPLLAIKARVVAVEPQEFCQKILKLKFKDKIEIVPKGLGEKEEVREFYISDSSYLSSFSTNWIDSVKKNRFKENNWNTVRKVQMTTLDKLIQAYGVPAFIKIDVEGYELEVLKGLTTAIDMISFEYTTPELTANVINCIERIRTINPAIECNFSVGENMHFALNEFIDADKMLHFVNSREFIDTGFGDIYVRRKK